MIDPPGDDGSPRLATSVTYEAGVALVSVSGEIDLGTARAFARRLETTLTGDPVGVIADLQGVAFLSSAGLAALQIFAAAAEAAGVAFCLVSDHRTVLRPLQLTALDRGITIRPTVAEARTWLTGRS
ncbi:anti-sigma factor antagonist [Amycolatopsis sp. cmx-4-61]|uniref:anti-sigma factor antagonist n=1 Tax=Amycolatopsis sp. cmx-4-61 TaxID=2790937 RepID=UPI003978F104